MRDSIGLTVMLAGALLLAASGAVLCDDSWSVSGQGMSLSLAAPQTGGLELSSLRNTDSGFDWCGAQQPTGLYMTVGSGNVSGLRASNGFAFAGAVTSSANGSNTVRVDMARAVDGLRASASVTCFNDAPVVEWRSTVRNNGTAAMPVSELGPLYLRLRGDQSSAPTVHWVTRNPYGKQSQVLTSSVEIHGGDWNAPECAGWVAIEHAARSEVLFIGFEWERRWRIRIDRQDGDIVVTANLYAMGTSLAPGTSLSSPRVFVGVSHGDIDDSVRSLHDYLRNRVMPARLAGSPWVTYDFWATDASGVEAATEDEIAFADDLGVEVFYLDAAWYEGSCKNGSGDWFTGLGNWQQEDTVKYPHGLASISQKVHQAGMRFGLWFCPQMVDSSLVGGRIPTSWVAQCNGGNISLDLGNGWATITQICLGDPEVVAYLKSALASAIQRYNLDWLKWDNSGLPGSVCRRADHGHLATDGEFAAMQGEYEIFRYLHQQFPNLVIEECGYPSRIDYGKARYCRSNWLSDSSWPSQHVRQNALASSYVYPTPCVTSFMYQSGEFSSATPAQDLDTMFRSRMLGLFGFGTMFGTLAERVSRYPTNVLAKARSNIIAYKSYRHLLWEDVYHPLPASTGPGQWDAVEFCARDGSEAIVLCFRNSSSQASQRIALRGLTPSRLYAVRGSDGGTIAIGTGSELAGGGISIGLPAGDSSDVLTIGAPGSYGTITGRVTDSATGQGLGGARLSAAPGGSYCTSGEDGAYSLFVSSGVYTVSASKAVYDSGSVTGVSVAEGATVPGVDLALTKATGNLAVFSTFSANLTDGSSSTVFGNDGDRQTSWKMGVWQGWNGAGYCQLEWPVPITFTASRLYMPQNNIWGGDAYYGIVFQKWDDTRQVWSDWYMGHTSSAKLTPQGDRLVEIVSPVPITTSKIRCTAGHFGLSPVAVSEWEVYDAPFAGSSISGVVTNSVTGAALQHVKVTSGGREAITDSDGRYSLSLDPGIHIMSASRAWFAGAVSAPITVGTSETVTGVNLSLAPVAASQLQVHANAYASAFIATNEYWNANDGSGTPWQGCYPALSDSLVLDWGVPVTISGVACSNGGRSAGYHVSVWDDAADDWDALYEIQSPDMSFVVSPPIAASKLKVIVESPGPYPVIVPEVQVTGSEVVPSLPGAKESADGTAASAIGWLVSAVFADGLYIQHPDRSRGIRVMGSPAANRGDLVNVSGIMGTSDGERVLWPADMVVLAHAGLVWPLGVTNKGLAGGDQALDLGVTGGFGLNNLGLLVRTSGVVTAVDGSTLWIDDGSGLPAGAGLCVRGAIGTFAVGESVAVTGISSVGEQAGTRYRVIRPRDSADIEVFSPEN